MWSSSSSTTTRQINYGLPEMGMLGLCDVFEVDDQHSRHPYSNNTSLANATSATALGVGVVPLLTAAPCFNIEEDMLNNRCSGGGGGSGSGSGSGSGCNTSNSNNCSIKFWHQHPQTQQNNYLNNNDHGFIGRSTSGSTLTCQDCGNQAKKDCTHRRCRTCCKSRGFDCSTHVKSTWVPAARRRDRHTTSTGGASVSSASTSGPKKPRLTSHTTTTSHTSTSTSNTTLSRSIDTSSSHHQDASFNESLSGQVRAPAVFKCVRVTVVEDGDDEYAYQASATIGGHVFKGFVYDQGLETRDHTSFGNFSELRLRGSSGRNVGGSSSSPLVDPSDGGLITGSTYGHPTN